MTQAQHPNTTRRFRYIQTFGKAYGYWLFFLEKIGLHLTINVQYAGDKLAFRLNTSDIDVLYTIFVRQDYQMEFTAPPTVIVDAGAYVGYSSIYFARKYPQAIIIAVEPLEENYLMLKRNAAKYPQVIPLQRALWFETTRVEFVNRNTGFWGYTINKNLKSFFSDSILVETITLNDIMVNCNFETIDLLKIDIEGAEKELFEHSQSWIGSVNVIAAELHDRIKEGCSDVFESATKDFVFQRRNMMTVFKSKIGSI